MLLGAFNPRIFQPAWLAQHGLIRPEESENAQIDIISTEIAIYSIGNFRLLAQSERFQLETTAAEEGIALKDLAVAIFRLLEHTELRALGINHNMHFRVESEDNWNKVGHRLVPKDLWEGVVDNAGTRSVIVESKNPLTEGRLQVRIEPSTRTLPHPGIYVSTNLHFAGEEISIIETLDRVWLDAQRDSRQLAETLLSRCLE